MLYRIGLPSNRATPLALIGGSLQIELQIRTNRAIVLENSCIWSTTWFPPKRAILGLVILDYRDSNVSVLQTS